MKSFLPFLLIPCAVLAGLSAAHFAPVELATVFLPAVQSLNVPLSPDALPTVSRRNPAVVNFRSLITLDTSTAPVVTVAVTPLIVSAIFVDGERRIIQIDSEMYQMGDSIAGYRVQQIEPMRVLLVDKSGTQRWVDLAKGY